MKKFVFLFVFLSCSVVYATTQYYVRYQNYMDTPDLWVMNAPFMNHPHSHEWQISSADINDQNVMYLSYNGSGVVTRVDWHYADFGSIRAWYCDHFFTPAVPTNSPSTNFWVDASNVFFECSGHVQNPFAFDLDVVGQYLDSEGNVVREATIFSPVPAGTYNAYDWDYNLAFLEGEEGFRVVNRPTSGLSDEAAYVLCDENGYIRDDLIDSEYVTSISGLGANSVITTYESIPRTSVEQQQQFVSDQTGAIHEQGASYSQAMIVDLNQSSDFSEAAHILVTKPAIAESAAGGVASINLSGLKGSVDSVKTAVDSGSGNIVAAVGSASDEISGAVGQGADDVSAAVGAGAASVAGSVGALGDTLTGSLDANFGALMGTGTGTLQYNGDDPNEGLAEVGSGSGYNLDLVDFEGGTADAVDNISGVFSDFFSFDFPTVSGRVYQYDLGNDKFPLTVNVTKYASQIEMFRLLVGWACTLIFINRLAEISRKGIA